MDRNSNILTIKLNTKCNLNCIYCNEWYRVAWDLIGTHFLWYEAIKQKAIADLENWKNIFSWVVFTAWEPTLNPHLPDIIHYAHNVWYKYIELVTNGIRVANKSYLQELYMAGLSSIIISVNSFDPRISKIISGNNYNGRATFLGITNAVALWMNVTINIVITKMTIISLKQTLIILHKIGVKKVVLCYVKYAGFNESIYEWFTKAERNKLSYSEFSSFFQKKNFIEIISRFDSCIFNDFPICTLGHLRIPFKNIKQSKWYHMYKNQKIYSKKHAWSDRMFFPQCELCQKKNQCSGVELEYVEIFWERFSANEINPYV